MIKPKLIRRLVENPNLNADTNQSVRTKRHFIAVGTSLLVLTLVVAATILKVIPFQAGVSTSILIIVLVALFNLIFMTRFNKRFNDPSLTTLQILASSFSMLYLMYLSPEARSLFITIFFISFSFGVFKLQMKSLIILASLLSAAYAFVVFASYSFNSTPTDFTFEFVRWSILTFVLYWFSFMTGYVSHLRQKLQKTIHLVKEMAIHDDLTQIYNRRHLTEIMEREKRISDRAHTTFCICIFDLDFFKEINDQYGHDLGDEVLKNFSHLVQSETRSTDYFGRYGGDEFLLVLTHTNLEGASIRSERLRATLENYQLSSPVPELRLTLSIGITQYHPQEPISEMIKRADQALYKAKLHSRNRVAVEP